MNDNYVELIAEEDIEEYINIRWDFVIADEAHKLLASIYNHYQGSRKEQSVLNNYIFDKEMNIRLQNDSVGSYISSDISNQSYGLV